MIHIKKLTKSDLTIIDRFWRSNLRQEAIVLGKRYIEVLGDEYLKMNRLVPIPMQMIFFGPEGKSAIVKSGASIGRMTHDWRIQSCSLKYPKEDTERFSILTPDDLFVFSLEINDDERIGRGLFISRASQKDLSLYNSLLSYGNKVVETKTINTLLQENTIETGHPIYSVINQTNDMEFDEITPFEFESQVTETEFTDSLEAGSLGATGKIRKISKDELSARLDEANRIGTGGENIFNTWLDNKPTINNKRVKKHIWKAETYATAPYDFEVTFDDGTKSLLELKTTSGPFNNTVYLSSAELNIMAEANSNVILVRLFDFNDDPKICFAFDTKEKAELILSSISFPAPQQVGLVSIWVKPDFFAFEEKIII